MNKVSLIKKVQFFGYAWGIIGLIIIGISNFILISNHLNTYWFLPINVRDNLLTAIILLFPVVIILVTSLLLRKNNEQ